MRFIANPVKYGLARAGGVEFRMADRRAIAEKLVDLYVKLAGPFGEIDDLKEKLRKEAESEGRGFKEEFAGKGLVQVSAGSEEECKGKDAALNLGAYYNLSDRQQEKLKADKIVIEKLLWTKATRPSVTVKL